MNPSRIVPFGPVGIHRFVFPCVPIGPFGRDETTRLPRVVVALIGTHPTQTSKKKSAVCGNLPSWDQNPESTDEYGQHELAPIRQKPVRKRPFLVHVHGYSSPCWSCSGPCMGMTRPQSAGRLPPGHASWLLLRGGRPTRPPSSVGGALWRCPPRFHWE
jgi:hypothetical protein